MSTAGQAFPPVDTLDGKAYAHASLALFAGHLLIFCLFQEYLFWWRFKSISFHGNGTDSPLPKWESPAGKP